MKADRYGSLLILIIMAKLPPEIRVHIARNTTQEIWNIESILNVIQSEIEMREISDKVKAMTSSIEPKRPSYQKPGNSTTSSFLAGSQLPFQTPKQFIALRGIFLPLAKSSLTATLRNPS